MIKTLRGQVIGLNPPQIIVEAGGVGYEVFLPLNHFDQIALKEEVFLHTHHHITENGESLYGFLDNVTSDFFQMLLSVSGVGPKVALSIIGVHSVADLKSAAASGETALFTAAPGVGQKLAERIIVDLKGKIGVQPGLNPSLGDTYEALVALGYKPAEVRRVLNQISGTGNDTGNQIKEALKLLARG